MSFAAISRGSRITVTVVALLALGGCAETEFMISGAKRLSESGSGADSATAGSRYKVGAPYKVGGSWYYPKVDYSYSETGIASWYGPNFHGKHTANGEEFDMNRITAAHRTLPLPSIVQVTNLDNGRSLKVRVNDRGPFARGRIIDVSRRAAQLLGFERQGTAKVRVTVLERESRQLAASYGVREAPGSAQPPPPKAAPRVAVTSTTLEAPPGAKVAPPPTESRRVVPVATAPVHEVRETVEPTQVVDGKVTIVPVTGKRQIYVQAGAFSRFDYANRLRALLSPIGKAKIYQVTIVDRPMFRVRFGPLASVEEADRLLANVVHAGHQDARIVVD